MTITEALKASRKENKAYQEANPSTYVRDDSFYKTANDLQREEKSIMRVRKSSKFGSLEYGAKRIYNFYCGTVSGFASQGVLEMLREQKSIGVTDFDFSNCEVTYIQEGEHKGKLSLQMMPGVDDFCSSLDHLKG